MPCARQCRGVFRALCARCWVAHRIERNPDWKVFLNMAAAAGALTHVRSASGPGAHGWERQQERARAGMRYAMR